MHGQLLQSSGAQRADAGIIPDIGPIASMLAELKIVDVRASSALPHEHQLVLGAIKRSHTRISLVPDTQVLELAVDLAAGGQHLPHVPPIHADLMDGAVNRVLSEAAKHRFQECCKFSLTHFAASHCELAMPDAAEPADVAIDRNIVRRVREDEFRLGAF